MEIIPENFWRWDDNNEFQDFFVAGNSRNGRRGGRGINDPYFSRINDVPLISEVSSNGWVFVEASRPRPRDLLLRWAFHRVMMGSRPWSGPVRNIVLSFRYLRMIPSDQVFVASRWTVARRMLTSRLVLVALPRWLDPIIYKNSSHIRKHQMMINISRSY